jgi:hypothetical protein
MPQGAEVGRFARAAQTPGSGARTVPGLFRGALGWQGPLPASLNACGWKGSRPARGALEGPPPCPADDTAGPGSGKSGAWGDTTSFTGLPRSPGPADGHPRDRGDRNRRAGAVPRLWPSGQAPGPILTNPGPGRSQAPSLSHGKESLPPYTTCWPGWGFCPPGWGAEPGTLLFSDPRKSRFQILAGTPRIARR